MKLKPAYCLIAFLSSAFQAFGMNNVHALSGVTEGGVLGLTLLIDHWFAISPAVSVIAAAGFSVGYAICELFPPLLPGIAGHPLLAAVVGALFIGIGAGICVRIGGATCGDDALAMSLSHILKTPVERIYLVSDLTVLGLSLSYIPLQRIIYSLITVILSGQIIGWIQKIHAKKRLA